MTELLDPFLASRRALPSVIGFVTDNTASTLMLCFAAAGAPFLFGSQDPPTVAFWCVWLGFATLIASPRALRGPHLRLLAGLVCILLAVALVLHEQIADRPWFAKAEPIWAEASKALGIAIAPSAAAVKRSAFFNVGPMIANALSLILGLVIGSDAKRARSVLYATAIAGAFYAIYGIYMTFVSPNYVLWREKDYYVGELTSTFTFRNTAAVYFGAVSVVWLVLLCESVEKLRPQGRWNWRSVARRLIVKRRLDVLGQGVAFFICLTALLMTHSRAGIVLSAGALLLAIWLFFARELRTVADRKLVIVSLIGGSLLVMQILAGAVANRLNAEGLGDSQRYVTYKATWRMICDHPWFGVGLGGFSWIFPAYRADHASMWGVWQVAHSTPLELAAEMGLPCFLIIATGWLAAMVVLLRGALVRRRNKAIPVAAFAVASIALLHSLIDFSLQVAGFAIVVFAMVGIGLSQSFRSRAGVRTLGPLTADTCARGGPPIA